MRTVISTICTKMKSFGNDTLIPMRNRAKSRENDYLFGNALVHIYIYKRGGRECVGSQAELSWFVPELLEKYQIYTSMY